MSIDLHTHSTYSDGADSLEDNLAAAIARGIRQLGFSDHVRRTTSWLDEYTTHVAALRKDAPIGILCGVESKMLDVSGRLDLPDDLSGVDYVAIADHQMPGIDGPEHPRLVRSAIQYGQRTAGEVVEELIAALISAAWHAPCRPLVVHPFSILQKVGLSERDVPDRLLAELGSALAQTGAWVEANEKWRCPTHRVMAAFGAAGVRLVTGSDAHTSGQVGAYDWVRTRHPGLLAEATAATVAVQ